MDKTELENAVNDASKIDSNDYTADSFSKLQDALVAAKTVLNNKNASQDEVNNALNALKTAKDQLEKKSVAVTPSKDNNKTQTTNKNNAVKTGDNTQLAALSVAATVAAVAGATIMIKTKKKEI